MPSSAASQVATHFLQFRIQYSSIALLYYDYALTFPSEIKYMWGQKFRFSTILYIFCRYAMVANILYVLAVTGKLHQRVNGFLAVTSKVTRTNCRTRSPVCDAWYKFDGALSVLGRAAVIATLTARTYAVFGCSRRILILLGALGVACIVLDIMHVPGLRCVGSSGSQLYVSNVWLNLECSDEFPSTIEVCQYAMQIVPSPAECLKLTNFHRRPAIIAADLLSILMRVLELLAAVLTSVRSFMEFRIGRSWKFERGSFVVVVFNQGVIYIVFSTIFSIVAALLQFRAPPDSLFQRLFNSLSLPLSCLLTARFLLQLREWQSSTYHSNVNYGTQSQRPETLSAFRATEVLDAAVVDDFGDGDGEYLSAMHTSSGWESESTRIHRGDTEMEMGPRQIDGAP